MTANLLQRREQASVPMLLLAAAAILIAIVALFLGKITGVTAMLAAILAVSILAIRARNELLRLFKLFLLATFCVLPAWQLAAGDEIYLNLLPQDSAAVMLWFLLSIAGVWFLKLALDVAQRRLVTHEPASYGRTGVTGWVYFFALASVAAIVFIYVKLGGYANIVELYDERLQSSVTGYDPLGGLGIVQALANTAPLWIFVCLTLRPRCSKLMTVFAFTQLGVLGWLASGVFGNRQGIIFVYLFAALLYHFLIAPVSRRAAKTSAVLLAVIALVLMPLKFGVDYSDLGKIGERFADQRALELSMGPVSFFLFRDLSRFDVQAQTIETVMKTSYDLPLGRSFAGAAASIVPKVLWDDRPATFAQEKSDIVSYVQSSGGDETTLLFGMPGEFLANFGLIGYVLAFGIPAVLLVAVNALSNSRNRKWLPLRIVLMPLPFLFFLFDSNVIAYYVVRWIVLFALPMAFVLRFSKPGNDTVASGGRTS
ncbi:hypothetical protein AWB69_02600 [Caballeronia udeis]|uniref:O-antigen polysaccharide polymerase Wzy n=1 Tax=Caballeronia udeis TaxID=1232866 RepID=A0A158GGV4_9BURK|nr:hypothetical protein [Caballeronia udeis]SAL31137.1 hypothetical protein AWB69_02600 [Caballeronia udeis]